VEILLASGNPKKLRELRALLEGRSLRILAPSDVGGIPDVIEDAPTFAGNAAKKASSAARARGRWALADDSGLEVDALGGAPGVRSARFAGERCDDAANNRKLLDALAGLSDERRGARFVCALALASPDGALALEVQGEARGRILRAPRGSGDFGYDPLFLFTEEGHSQCGRGFAELGPAEKSAVSHRGRALRALLSALETLEARVGGGDGAARER
jgi:XTP/dITP diphosphohydrolase